MVGSKACLSKEKRRLGYHIKNRVTGRNKRNRWERRSCIFATISDIVTTAI